MYVSTYYLNKEESKKIDVDYGKSIYKFDIEMEGIHAPIYKKEKGKNKNNFKEIFKNLNLGEIAPSDEDIFKEVADFDQDGVINLEDFRKILMRILNK